MPGPNEIIFIDNDQQYMYVPARETSQAHMVTVPAGFTAEFRKAYKEWVKCQNVINQIMTGQDNDDGTYGDFIESRWSSVD